MTDQPPASQVPGGAGQSLPVQFRHEWCKKCGICIEFCPRKALAAGAKDLPFLSNPAACTQCRLCELLCPDFVITVTPRRQKAGGSAPEGDPQ